ncbi:MAG TPA: GNAT family N-acetyltransferase [Candidatus Elarobacter sp.]|jgi:L-amino acid N-acyltransferase YncA|nr:GNAT family N-acetyltransferase [Candidatus Elarobacter sp.]
MNETSARTYPRTVPLGENVVELRFMRAGDEAAVLAFARELPAHDLLFLPRDITQPKVLAAWVHEIERGAMMSLLAFRGGEVVGCATIVRDPLSWSPHVAELRVVVARKARGIGLGRLLSADAGELAVASGVEKLIAKLTPDQIGAVTVFETMGYKAEALLRDHVKDADGIKHDLVILSLDVERFRTRAAAYGLSGE